jgi:hypothetical protein
MAIKIQSGGQTGVDQAALFAAREVGLKTGGYITKDFMTNEGPMPSLGERFGLIPLKTKSYAIRTYKNVQTAGATLILTYDLESRGTVCTIKACKKYAVKPLIFMMSGELDERALIRARRRLNGIRVLNVAGSRKTNNNNAFSDSFYFLKRLFNELKNKG